MIIKLNIRQKFVLYVGVVVFCGIAAILWAGHTMVYSMRYNTIVTERLNAARRLTGVVGDILEETIKDISIITHNPDWIESIEKKNASYAGARPTQEYFMRMDERWTARDDEWLREEYLDNSISRRLRQLQNDAGELLEILFTDIYGGIVASSGKTTDYYQADEEWWQKAFNDGVGRIYVSDVEFDESIRKWGIAIAIPIRSAEGALIGICKAFVDTVALFRPIEMVKFGKTGRALLIDEEGIMLSELIGPGKVGKISTDARLTRLIKKTDGGEVVAIQSDKRQAKFLASIAKVNNIHLTKNNVEWFLIILEEYDEVFAPIKNIFLNLSILILLLIIIIIPVSYAASVVYTDPIKKLQAATEHVAAGDFDGKVYVRTGDEVELLADSFNTMSASLKQKTTSIDNLNAEIKERKRAEEELIKSHLKINEAANEWKRTFDSITDLVFIQDMDFRIVKANKSFLKAVGKTSEEVIGRKCYEVCHHADHPWPNCPFKETLVTRLPASSEVDDPNIGVPLLVTTSPVFDDNGRLIGSVHISKDISSIKKTQEELEKKNKELEKLDKLKNDFVSTVSHELRTPLSITKEGISLVLDKITGEINDKQSKVLITAKDNIDRLARIIDDLLDISKIESGQIILKKTMINMKDLVVKASYSLMGKIKEKGIEYKLSVEEKDIFIYADFDKIMQLFINLIDNAVKFTEKGRIEVSLVENREGVECCVKDTGVGIAKDDMPNVFGKFQQFNRTPGPGHKGTGLGLAISKKIVELHGGKIWAQSEQGKGTVFCFLLPKLPAKK